MTSMCDKQSFNSPLSLISAFLLLPGCTQALPSIWQVHIANEPTEATRNHPLLGVELGAIFGSYLLFVIFVCIGILTVGRRLRRASQASPSTLGMDIVKPVQPIQMQPSTTNPWGPSPISPAKSTEHQWPSPKPAGGWGSIRSKHAHKTSLQSSVITFDESVIEEDKTKNEFEMDRLYAAVAEHEAEQTKKQSLVSSRSTNAPLSPRSINPPLSPLQQHPPELQHLRNGRAPMPEQYPLSPPPDSDQYPYRQNTTSPGRTSTKSPRRLNKPSPIMVSDPHSRNSSRSSFASYGRKQGSVRGLPISPPMGSPDFNPENAQHYGDTEPLTPRYYNLPPPPPTPPQRNEPLGSPQPGDTERRFHFAPSIRSSRNSIASTYASPSQTPRTATFPVAPPPAIAEEQTSRTTHIAGGFNFALDPAPSSGSSTPRSTTTVKTSKSKSKPAPLSLTNAGSTSQSSLSLRTAPLPFRSLLSPRSQRAPANDIRATELTRPDKNRLMAPGSAVPATPYSPYMPQTPLTPMTPSRLVTREERKRMKKEQGRRVLTAEDAVPEEDDMWGEGY